MPGSLDAAIHLLGALGAAAILWGSVNALRVASAKALVAHSTVAQLGLMFLLPPMVQAGSANAWTGGTVQALAHGPAKAAALMAVALMIRDTPNGAVAELNGAATRRPVAVFAFGVAALSLVGLPPSGGFLAKWYLLLGAVETGQWWWVIVIVVASLLSAAYLMRIVKTSFAPPDTGPAPVPTRDGRDVLALILALSALVVGLRPTELVDLLRLGAPALGAG